ncbi:MAG: hypothetical protein NZ765_09615 [Anaerolineae bacterium]|nr:hypothetical protein [Anaerolineae bacterium]MDW8071870.1 hypothetical protein [Anaerolineae bacterium]
MTKRQAAMIERKAVKAYLRRKLAKVTDPAARQVLEQTIRWVEGRPARYRKRKGGL